MSSVMAMTRAVARLRSAGGWYLLALTAAACAGDPPTVITVRIDTEFFQPGEKADRAAEINQLRLIVKDRSGKDLLPEKSWNLGPGPGAVKLPSELALVREGDNNGPITIDVEGWIGPRRMVSRRVRKAFRSGQAELVEVMLARECLSVTCPSNLDLTCVPGAGCQDPAFALPPNGKVLQIGPPCDCANSYFPLCVRAWWTYDVYQGNNTTPSTKAWSFPYHGVVGDPMFGLENKPAFLQFKIDQLDVTRRWVARDLVSGSWKLYWLKDETVGSMGQTLGRSYYNSPRLRFDEGLVEGVTLPALMYDEIRHPAPGETRPIVPITTTDTWTWVSAPDVVRLVPGDRSHFPKQWRDVARCQLRHSVDAATKNTFDRYFCFVKGIGKVYELTTGAIEEEVLREYYLPGAPGTGCPNQRVTPESGP
jgi:hypothetical protein